MIRMISTSSVIQRRKVCVFMDFQMSSGKLIFLQMRSHQNYLSLLRAFTLPEMECERNIVAVLAGSKSYSSDSIVSLKLDKPSLLPSEPSSFDSRKMDADLFFLDNRQPKDEEIESVDALFSAAVQSMRDGRANR